MVTRSARLAVLWFTTARPIAREFAIAQDIVAFVGNTATLFFFVIADYLTSDIFAELLFIFVVIWYIFIIFFDNSTSKLPLS